MLPLPHWMLQRQNLLIKAFPALKSQAPRGCRGWGQGTAAEAWKRTQSGFLPREELSHSCFGLWYQPLSHNPSRLWTVTCQSGGLDVTLSPSVTTP